jgi:hypothetical protein
MFNFGHGPRCKVKDEKRGALLASWLVRGFSYFVGAKWLAYRVEHGISVGARMDGFDREKRRKMECI